MIRLADDPVYDFVHGSKGRVAQFSPDGKQFVVVLKKGNLEQNTNEFSVLFYRTVEALHSPRPEILLTMSSSSNRDAVSKVRWLPDNETLVFLGENPGETAQVYALDIGSRRLKKLTNHSTSITNYENAADGQKILFLAEPPAKEMKDTDQARRNGVVIMEQYLPNLLAGNCATSYCGLGEQQLFLQRGQQPPVQLSVKDLAWNGCPLSFSPDGRYAVVGVNIMYKDLPHTWADYEFPHHMQNLFKNTKGFALPFNRYLVVDTQELTVVPLWNAPMIGFPQLTWAADSRSFLFRSYLPLEGTDTTEREARKKNVYPVKIKVPSLEYGKVTESEFPKENNASVPLAVSIEGDLNTPPKIYVSEPKTHQKAMLLDLNPQVGELNLRKVETVEWIAAAGIQVRGGLYLPPDYTPGKRYPLVIQTHGFSSSSFSMDGTKDEWSSGYAARALAAKGMVVLQAYDLKRQEDYGRVYQDRTLGANPEQAARNLDVSAFEGAIEELDKEGLIDRGRVGIMGFSRTVCYVAYALTHSKYHFAAAILVDGIDAGYFQYLVMPGDHTDADYLNGGTSPFGEGLAGWLKESPGFNLDKVHTPVRLEAHGASGGGLLNSWEWFFGLSLLGKPVECIYLPDADHLLIKPWERRTSQQGAVDWFRFWLNGEQDPDPAKADQYLRWRELRKMQDENDAKAKVAPDN